MDINIKDVNGNFYTFSDTPPAVAVGQEVVNPWYEWVRKYTSRLTINQRERNLSAFLQHLIPKFCADPKKAPTQIGLNYIYSMMSSDHVAYQNGMATLQQLNVGKFGWWIKPVILTTLSLPEYSPNQVAFCFVPIISDEEEEQDDGSDWVPTPESKLEWSRLKTIINAAKGERLIVALGGDPSIGKTYIAEHEGLDDGQEVLTITMTEDTFAQEIKGHPITVSGGVMEWCDGPGPRCWRNGGRLVVNEIQRSSGNSLSYYLELLDSSNSAKSTLPPPSRETITPSPKFQCIASYNGEFDDMPEALKSRFAMNIHLKSPNPDAIRALPVDLRMLAATTCCLDDISRRISLRHWFEFDRWRKKIDEEAAAWAIFGGQHRELLDQIRMLKVR